MAVGNRKYVPPGPVAAKFLQSWDFFQAIMGPVGSGKTGACLNRMIYATLRQAPHPQDGVRRTKFAIVRDTMRQLEKTTIPSWHHWVPKDMPGCDWVGGSNGQPAKHTIRMALPDRTSIEMIVEFIGLGDGMVEDVMPGWEGTGAYLNEMDKLSPEVPTYIKGRVGRYPAVDLDMGFGGATWRGIWGDFNAPDIDHWLYPILVENIEKQADPKFRTSFFVQPGGMLKQNGVYIPNPLAENLANLPDGYYQQQIAGQPDWYIRRMVLNMWGANRDGQPVYEEYNDELHTAPVELEPAPGVPLIIGADAGLTGAATIGQRMPSGQIRILDELVAPPTGWGAGRFGKTMSQLLAERYSQWSRSGKDITCTCDPAALARSANDEQSWMEVFAASTGLNVKPASTNTPTMRQEAVRHNLTTLIDGQPGLWVSPRCRKLRKGFNSGYRLKRVRVTGTSELYADTPDKNEFSHVHDACQYMCLGQDGHMEVLGRKAARNSGPRQTHAITEDNPGGSFVSGRQTHAY